ncbi:hypothetical protein Tco_0005544 [Tanacetum coccineum]
MNPIVTQQVALDNALVAPAKRLKIERCNTRIEFSKPQKEETYQVSLDALKISPCYPAFQITAEMDKKKRRVDIEVFYEILQICPILPDQEFVDPPSKDEFGMFNQKNVDYVALLWEDFMYQADNKERSSARKEHMPYPRFTKFIINHFISKDKSISMRNRINLYTVRDDSLLGTLKFVSKTDESQKYGALIPDGMINQDIKDTVAYKTYYDYASGKVALKKARKYKKIASPSRKLSPILEAEPVKKAKQVKRHAKKTATVPTTGFVIRDTPGVSVLKKKAPAKVTKDKGIDLLSDVALLEVAQLKKALKETGIDKGTDDESNDVDSDDDNDSDNKNDDSKNDDDGDSDADDNERTNSDSDKEGNPNLNLKDGKEEETHDDEYVHTPDYYVPTDEESREENIELNDEEYENLYGDVNINLKDAEHEEGKGDEEMTDAGCENKIDSSKQSSSVSSGFATQFLNLDNVPPVDTEVASLIKIKDQNEEPSSQTSSLLTIPTPFTAATSTILLKEVSNFATPVIQSKITESLENVVFTKSSSQPISTYEAASSLTEFELKKILLDKIEKSTLYRATPEHRQLYDALIKSYNMDMDLFDSYGKNFFFKERS